MKMYRTISSKEFAELLFLGEISSEKHLQKSSVCFRNINGEDISASDENFNAICCFQEKLYWFLPESDRLVFLELDIPEEQILWNGYGIYYTETYNPYVFDYADNFFCQGEFGLRKKSLERVIKVPEFYISSYSLSDIKSVSFMNGANIFEKEIEEEDSDVWFNIYFSKFLFSIRRENRTLAKQGIVTKRNMDALWELEYLENVSLGTFKRYLKSMFPERKDFIESFQFFESMDNLERNLRRGLVDGDYSLNTYSLARLFEDVYTDEELYFFDNLKKAPKSVIPKIQELINNSLEYIKKYSGKELKYLSEMEDFCYTIMLKYGLL